MAKISKENIQPIEQFVIDAVTKFRKEHHVSQADIAAIIGMKISFVGNIESLYNASKYNIKHINMIAHHFRVSPRIFFPEEAL